MIFRGRFRLWTKPSSVSQPTSRSEAGSSFSDCSMNPRIVSVVRLYTATR
jgi:hypothetical protein